MDEGRKYPMWIRKPALAEFLLDQVSTGSESACEVRDAGVEVRKRRESDKNVGIRIPDEKALRTFAGWVGYRYEVAQSVHESYPDWWSRQELNLLTRAYNRTMRQYDGGVG